MNIVADRGSAIEPAKESQKWLGKIAWLVSLALHLAVLAIVGVQKDEGQDRSDRPILVEIRTPPPPQPVIPEPPKPEPPKPEPVKPKSKPKPVPLPQDTPVDLTSNPAENAPPPVESGPTGDVAPVMGVRKDAVRLGGSFKVRVGNTLGTEPGEFVAPDDVDDRVAPVPIATVTALPRIRSAAKPKYPEGMRRLAIEGVVTVEIVIDADGQVSEATIIESPDAAFDKPALEAARKTRFYPAKAGDRDVAVRIRIPVEFRLTN